jgi:hypothetical protein
MSFSWIGRKERAAQNIKPGKERTSVRDESEQRNDAVDGQMKGFSEGLSGKAEKVLSTILFWLLSGTPWWNKLQGNCLFINKALH